MGTINTVILANTYRLRVVDVDAKTVLLAHIAGSEQEQDLTLPPNCNGVGRVRHFRRESDSAWGPNPLPIDPASSFLGVQALDCMQAQVFQLAACSWRCWYCFVPDPMLSARNDASSFHTVEEIVDLYLGLTSRPSLLDLSGGQPDLVPEWPLWVLQELQRRGKSDHVYVWSDDNLSTDFYWRFLTEQNREEFRSFKNYGRVGCFKGYDSESFAFNTRAQPTDYETQFRIFAKLLAERLNMYAYVTLTGPTNVGLEDRVRSFVDRLQDVHHNLPLRTVPLKIQAFGPTNTRMTPAHRDALRVQDEAIQFWRAELACRFSTEELAVPIQDIALE